MSLLNKPKRNNQQYNNNLDILDFIGAMFVEIDCNNVVVSVNDSACSVLGYSKDQIIGKNWFENFVPVSDNSDFYAPSKEMDEFYDKPILTKNGDERLISWRKTTVKNDNNEAISYVCVGEDITKHENYLYTLRQISLLLLKDVREVPYRKFVKLIAEASNADHSYIFLNTIHKSGEIESSKICEWGGGHFIDNQDIEGGIQKFPLSSFLPDLTKKLSLGEVVHKKVSSLPQTERTFLSKQNIKSILIIPIIVDDRFVGFMGFDNRVNDGEWTYSEIEFLKASVKNLEQKIKHSKVDEALRNENARFQATMDAIDVMVLVSDFQTNQIIYCNAFANQKFGDIVGKSPMHALKLASPIPDTHYSLPNLLGDGTPNESKEYEVISEVNNRVYSCQIKAIKWIKGEWVRLETITDITEKRAVENRILESESKFKKLSTISVEGVFIHDKGVIMDMNQAVLDILQYKYEEVIGQNVIPIAVAPESHELVFSKLQEPSPKPYEIVGIRKDGLRIPLEIFARSVVHEGESIRVVTLRDITERKKIEQELIEQRNKAEESNQLKTQFLNNLSHEIRTPLNGIVGFTHFLTDPTLSKDKLKNFISIIQNSSHQLVRIMDDIIEISKLETKQVKPLIEPFNLNSLLLEMFSIFELKAIEKGVALHLNRELTDFQSEIKTDKTKLLKILNNLVENALKFTNKGEVEIGCRLESKKLKLWVSDTGIGIEPNTQNLIFDRFSQASEDTSKSYGGLGLGLSIAKENVELLGGQISVESKMGSGSKFTIILPYDPVNNKIDDTLDESDAKNAQYDFKVLVAEDEEVNFIFLEFLLQNMKSKVDVYHARNGKEAIELFENGKVFDLVFMDLKMPEIGGIEATKEIKSIQPNVPIIAITAYAGEEDRQLAVNAGCIDFLTKPITVEDFNEKCSYYLKK